MLQGQQANSDLYDWVPVYIKKSSKGGKREKLYITMTGQGWVKVEREGESKGEE